jgi:hypothetical protein
MCVSHEAELGGQHNIRWVLRVHFGDGSDETCMDVKSSHFFECPLSVGLKILFFSDISNIKNYFFSHL